MLGFVKRSYSHVDAHVDDSTIVIDRTYNI